MPSNGTYEEHIVSDTNTTNFEHSISVKKYKFGPETNRTILIYIYDFQTPLKIKVSIVWVLSQNSLPVLQVIKLTQ